LRIYERVSGVMGGLTLGNAAERRIAVKTNRDRSFQYRAARVDDVVDDEDVTSLDSVGGQLPDLEADILRRQGI
jgi:hypothetical protein